MGEREFHEHDAAGCLDCDCASAPMNSALCTCPTRDDASTGATDAVSGVGAVRYRVDGGAWQVAEIDAPAVMVWHDEADRLEVWGTLDPPDACMCRDCVTPPASTGGAS